MPDKKTTVERFNQDEQFARMMMGINNIPKRARMGMVETRRQHVFEWLWEGTDMSPTEVLSLVEDRELDMVEEYNHIDIPEFILRMEAQDVLLKIIHERFQEEGILD